MAEGFKKIFNGTTIAGRANVAKATYATMALIYIFYRARRGKGSEPPKNDDDAICSIIEDQEPKPEPEPEKKPEKDCAVCRERVRQRDRDQPPPPPPPPPAPAPERRVCKCEDPPPSKLPVSPQHKQSQPCSGSDADTVHPTRELISQMQESASRVLRNVIGAVIGERASHECNDSNDEQCSCCTPSTAGADMYEPAGVDQVDDEGCDYETSNQLYNSQRRTAPRHCGPEPGGANATEMHSIPDQLAADAQAQTQTQKPFRCLDDDFASEIFFGDE